MVLPAWTNTKRSWGRLESKSTVATTRGPDPRSVAVHPEDPGCVVGVTACRLLDLPGMPGSDPKQTLCNDKRHNRSVKCRPHPVRQHRPHSGVWHQLSWCKE
eukprot:766865-Hanusia_phi.AAC.4